MPRWRQVKNPETGKYELVPTDEAAAIRDGGGLIVRGNFDAFRSPIDGSVIRTQRDYDDHCKKHDVVPASEFSPEFYARKAKERERLFRGEHTTAERFQRKQQIHEIINYLERRNG